MRPISFASMSHRKQQNKWESDCLEKGLSPLTFDERILTAKEKEGYFGDRGYGFWFWKPLIIKKALETEEEILYADVDYEILDIEKIEEMLDDSASGVVLFTYPFQNRIWTKRDCFFYMNCDAERYWNTYHLEAGISIWRKTPYTETLLNEWLHYCLDRRILSDDPNVCGLSNFPEFRDHRHDQSILTNLKERWSIIPESIHSLRGVIEGSDI